MTAEEMQYKFQLKFYEYTQNIKMPTSYQIQQFLNEANLEVLDNIIKEGWDRNEYNRRAVSPLMKTEILTLDSSSPISETVWYILPTDVKIITSEFVTLTFTSGTFNTNVVSQAKVKPIREDYYLDNKDNPLKKPNHEVVWRLEGNDYDSIDSDDGKRVVLYKANNFDITTYTIRYLKKPNSIDILSNPIIDCELDSSVHDLVVTTAVRIADSALRDQIQYQTNTIESK